jgi:hypothetical protein
MGLNELIGSPVGVEDGTAVGRDSMAEMVLLLPGWQVAALEEAAFRRGKTAAQLARGLIRDFLSAADVDPR